MRWDEGHQSRDVEDRRGEVGGGGSGGLGLLLWLIMRTRYGWIIALLLFGFWVAQRYMAHSVARDSSQPIAANDKDAHFAAFVLDDTQAFWDERLGARYHHAKLVLFTDRTDTACGLGRAATGPFYCPSDEDVYIDLRFFHELDRMGAHGDFARAYVIAHEIGHHVQDVLGLKTGNTARGPQGGSVRAELQADCYAGIWAHSAEQRKMLDPGDIESALRAASRIGDDVLQEEESGRVRPETFTHGTSAQRYAWLKRGYETGALEACDTFSAKTL